MSDTITATFQVSTSDADQTRALGEDLGRILAAGDLVMLSGGLGAGKTTLTQGIGIGMGVRGRVASPTFIVARVHPSLSGGPDLIHADAYRIKDLSDLETLDLDSSLDEAVTVCTPTGTAGTASSTASSPPTAEPASTRLAPTSRITPCER